MDLKSLMISSKNIWVDFPGTKGFSVEVATLSRKELTKLRKSCTTQKFDRKNRGAMLEDLNEEAFVEKFTEATVKDWKGLTLNILESLILVDVEGKDLSEELPYSIENAELLVTNSTEFDNWLNEVIFDLETFRTKS